MSSKSKLLKCGNNNSHCMWHSLILTCVPAGLATEFKSWTTPTKTGGRWVALHCSLHHLNISKAVLFTLSTKSFSTINIQIAFEYTLYQPMSTASYHLGELKYFLAGQKSAQRQSEQMVNQCSYNKNIIFDTFFSYFYDWKMTTHCIYFQK